MLTETQAGTIIRAAPDLTQPANGSLYPKLKVSKVHRVFEPDRRGLTEVLYEATTGHPCTAFLKGNEVSYVEEGW